MRFRFSTYNVQNHPKEIDFDCHRIIQHLSELHEEYGSVGRSKVKFTTIAINYDDMTNTHRTPPPRKGTIENPAAVLAFLMSFNRKIGVKSWAMVTTEADVDTKSLYG